MDISSPNNKRLIVAITGASGANYGIRVLEILQADSRVETHLVISPSARLTINHETGRELSDVIALADVFHEHDDISASISSGSFDVAGMIVVPCTIKTLSAIANSYTDNLISRAADVQLKEGRPLLLVVSETPLHLGHLRLLAQAAEIGTIIMPPVPNWYARPSSLNDIVNNTAYRALRRLGFDYQSHYYWEGFPSSQD